MERINYNGLRCTKCGCKLKRPEHNLTFRRVSKLTCQACRKVLAINNGRTVQKRNAQIEVTEQQIQIIMGSALGDGSFERTPNAMTYGLSIKHGIKQKSYCLWKARLLSNIISKVDYPLDRIRLRTIRHPTVTKIAILFGMPKKKQISYKAIENLGPLGCAIWYLDDGSISPYKVHESGRRESITIRLSTCAFSIPEINILRNFLEKKLSIQTFICTWVSKKNFSGQLYDKPRKYYGIGIRGKNAITFLEFIKPELESQQHGMDYKLMTGIPFDPIIQNGSKNPSAKLNEQQIIEIRQKHSEGNTIYALAREYRMSHDQISKIIRRIRWKHVS